MMHVNVSQGIRSCLLFIEQCQEKNGSFSSIIGGKDFKKTSISHTTFTTSLVLTALGESKDNQIVQRISKRGLKFLMAEKSPQWSWNYWPRKSTRNITKPYPDDFDDTSLALASLHIHNKEILSGQSLAHITELLMTHETKVGGPYYTWLIPKTIETWKEVDIAVNANIAFFLKLQGITLANITDFIETCIKTNSYSSKYYFSKIPILYFISRVYCGPWKDTAIQHLLMEQRKDGLWKDTLATAMSVSALVNWQAPVAVIEKAVLQLNTLAEKSIFEPKPLYVEEKKKETLYNGAAVVTAACIAQALTKYEQYRHPMPPKNESSLTHVNDIHHNIERAFLRKIGATSPVLKETCQRIVYRLNSNDPKHYITLLPYYFFQSINPQKKYADNVFIDLGLATLAGWTAYRIYDDILDNEKDSVDLLPLANICLRCVDEIFLDFLPKEEHSFYIQTMDAIDHANDWERKNCRIDILSPFLKPTRLPEYSNGSILAEKSLGYTLGPIAVLIGLGYKSDSSEICNLMTSLKHYIIARQMNDDAHDWLDDLRKGYINSASCRLFGILEKDTATEEELRTIFWNDTIPLIAKDIDNHIQKAKKFFGFMQATKRNHLIDALVLPIERSMKKAVAERKEMMDFLKNYSFKK